MKALVLLSLVSVCTSIRYNPTWESLDQRPLPQWYDDAKIGIFIHWGVYSVPSFGTEWFWSNWKMEVPQYVNFMRLNYKPGFTYQDFAKDFTAEFYDPNQWAKLFQLSGAKYVVLTSKHHDGYALWPSTYSYSWNSQDVGPNRDLIGDLAKSLRNHTNLKFGLYHSLYEWFHPLYLKDKSQNFKINEFSTNKVYPEMLELVEKYRPEIIWSDGEWEAPYTYWNSTHFIAWLYNDSPVKDTVVVNDRWGSGDIICHHGDFFTCTDRFNPGVLQPHKWENAMTIDKKSWGYRRNAKLTDYLTTYELIATLVITVSCGGNILINVGPRSDGIIDLIFQERLLDMGSWLSINGEAIYGSKPWIYQNDTIGSTWYTANNESVYAFTLFWPLSGILELTRAKSLFTDQETVVLLLGYPESLQWGVFNGKVGIRLPNKATVASQWVWVLKIISNKFF